MSITINQETCIKCQSCIAMAPETFTSDEDGNIMVISQDVTDEAQGAAQACPAQAIIIS